MAVTADDELRRLGGVAALGRWPRGTLVPGDVARQLYGVSLHPVDGKQLIARLERGRRGVGLLDRADLGRPGGRADEREEDDQQNEGDYQVDRGPREDDHYPLPHGLGVVGAGPNLVGQLLVGVHPADLHVAPCGDQADGVLGLPHTLRGDRGREEERELLDPHAHQLRNREMPQLVQYHQRGKAGKRQDPAQLLGVLSGARSA